jgi:hypothetical protein
MGTEVANKDEKDKGTVVQGNGGDLDASETLFRSLSPSHTHRRKSPLLLVIPTVATASLARVDTRIFDARSTSGCRFVDVSTRFRTAAFASVGSGSAFEGGTGSESLSVCHTPIQTAQNGRDEGD